MKAARINTGYGCYLILELSSNPSEWWSSWPFLLTYLPAVFGVFFRHLVTKMKIMDGRPAKPAE